MFETLTQDSLLQKCVHGGTQNTNEAFHHLIWERCPKTGFCGHRRIDLAVADATIVYNDGERKRLDIFEALAIKPGHYATVCIQKLDSLRITGYQDPAVAAQQRRQRALDKAQLNMDSTANIEIFNT